MGAPVIVANDGTTTCCGAYTTIFIDDGTEYCKCCREDVEGYDMTLPTGRPVASPTTRPAII
jgi:hypothetical protein